MAAPDSMTIRLHLHGVRVLDVVEDLPERVVIAVGLIASVLRCSACGRKTRRVHQTTPTRVRDLAISGRAATLVWHRRRFMCGACGATTTEAHPCFENKITARLARALVAETLISTVNAVRKRHGLSWALVMRVVAEHVAHVARRRIRRPVRVLCIDEKRLTKGHGPFSTVISDDDTGTVLAVFSGRSNATLEDFLDRQPRRWRAGVRVVVTDMTSTWATPIAERFCNADHVVDRFHVVRAGMAIVHQARRDAQRTPAGEPHHQDVFRARFVLLTRCDRLTAAQQRRLVALFDDYPELAAGWELMQRFHRVFEADGWDAALQAVDELADAMERTSTGFAAGVRAIVGHADKIEAWHRHGGVHSNGPAEGLMCRIELLERMAYGFTNPTNHHARVVHFCPGHPPRGLRSTRPGQAITTR